MQSEIATIITTGEQTAAYKTKLEKPLQAFLIGGWTSICLPAAKEEKDQTTSLKYITINTSLGRRGRSLYVPIARDVEVAENRNHSKLD